MLRGAVIGMGRMGITHFSILNNHPEVQFVSICDSSDFILKNFERQTGIAIFTNYRKLIDKSKPDFVIVCTPTSSHAEIVKYAFVRNIHVFVEKPFTLTCREGQELVDLAREKKLVNQVGYVNRFSEVFCEVKKHITEGLIGDLTHFRFEMYGPTVTKPTKASWRSKKTEGGGCLYDFSSHCVDLINFYIGMPDLTVGSILKKIYSEDVEDAVYTNFVYKSGVTGQLMANWSDASFRKPLYKIELQGRKGKVIADQHAYKVFLAESNEQKGFDKGWDTRYVTDFSDNVRFYVRGNEFTKQLDYFIDSITGKENNSISTFADALMTDRIIEEIIKDYEERNGKCN
jgi:predicted dehydrogenase